MTEARRLADKGWRGAGFKGGKARVGLWVGALGAGGRSSPISMRAITSFRGDNPNHLIYLHPRALPLCDIEAPSGREAHADEDGHSFFPPSCPVCVPPSPFHQQQNNNNNKRTGDRGLGLHVSVGDCAAQHAPPLVTTKGSKKRRLLNEN